MYLGYSSYFLLIVIVTFYYFFQRYQEFRRTSFVILSSFFVYYVIFVLLPVTGPQYYYLAVGVDNIAQGVFPPVGDFFLTHDEMMEMPGWKDGFFYQFMMHAHAAGERPTAAFPSSHVGVTFILLLLAWRSRSRRLVCIVLPFFLLMCLATVYIRAHYAIDVVAGLLSGFLFYIILQGVYPRVEKFKN
jgi:membrane-associated phospholipid phosphatase